MIPYFCIHTVNKALFVSIGITAVMLIVFGYVKAIVTGTNRRTALFCATETLLIGTIAAGVSYGIVKGVDTGFDLGS
jgi:VIT1/CCC1 family predicted Fe2+/Mn2+ transporter